MSGKRVLVVDDEPEVTFALQAFFLGKGYEMLTALDGLQAMKLLKQHSIDLVLLDMKMPGVNGVEVLKFIHAETPNAKVIVVTAYDVQFQEMVEQMGVDGFLIKPFGIQALTKTVEYVLAGKPVIKLVVPDKLQPGGPTPKARLLFVEPAEYTYQLKEVFFADPERCGGEYEVRVSYSLEEAVGELKARGCDILLVDLAILGKASDLAAEIMASDFKPKELILHGSGSVLASHQDAKVTDLSRLGVKVVQNESFTRAGLVRLAGTVRKAAIANKLLAEGSSPA